MKGLAGSAGAVAVIAFGVFSGANADSSVQEVAEYGSTGSVDDAASPPMNALNESLSRRLQASGRRGRPRPRPPVTDDALDPTGTVSADNHVVCSGLRKKPGAGWGEGMSAPIKQ